MTVPSDFKPLPRPVRWWRETRNQRQAALTTLKSTAAALLTLAVSVLGAILVSYGVYQVYVPAGYVVGGLMCWLLLWSHEKDKGGGR
jgi:ABC-type spermidine/putrescine transport system permease subunit II